MNAVLIIHTLSATMQAVEATAATGQLVYAPDSDTEQLAIAPITGYAVAIPTMNAIHGQDGWKGTHVSVEYGDHSHWSVDTIVEMLTKFFAAANAVSLPELAEYHWRLDKVYTTFAPLSTPGINAWDPVVICHLVVFTVSGYVVSGCVASLCHSQVSNCYAFDMPKPCSPLPFL